MREIVIWGTGLEAEEFYYHIRNQDIRVLYFLDNHAVADKFHGCEIRKPDWENTQNCFIVVATNRWYEQIAEQLRSYGRREIKDFILYKAWNRTIVLFHGNCYMGVLGHIMRTSETFNRKYYIYPCPLIHENTKGYIEPDLLSYSDVFIYQDIRSDNKFGKRLSAEYAVAAFLENNKNKEAICVPNFVGLGKGFFPQDIDNKYNRDTKIPMGMFPHGDANIERMWMAGEDLDEIVKYISGDIYSEQYIIDNFNRYMDKIIAREKNWDVKITDYLLSTYQKEQIFYEKDHPCNNVLKEICRGVFEILGLDKDTIEDFDEVNLSGREMPIYKCVKKALGLKYSSGSIRKKVGRFCPGDMDLAEYVREYCYYCFE